MYGNKALATTANEGCAVGREPLAADILRYGESLANRAQSLAERVNGKLRPVMTSETPRAMPDCAKDAREWPPLFNELRNYFDAVGSALESIDYAMSRTEL